MMRPAAQLAKWCIQSTQSHCGRRRTADKELFLLCSEPFRCFKERAPGTIFGTIATICKTTRCRKHFFLSSAALARPCTQPCRPCWQRRSPLCAAKHWRHVLPRATSSLCTAACLHTPSRVAQPRCNASRGLRRRCETHSSGILPSTA